MRTVEIPDEVDATLHEHWAKSRPHRAQRGEGQLQRWLGFATRMEAHAFLKEHGVPLNYTLQDLEQDRQTYQRLGL